MTEEQRTIFMLPDPRRQIFMKLHSAIRQAKSTSSMTLIEQRELLYMLQRFPHEIEEPVKAWVNAEGTNTIRRGKIYQQVDEKLGIPESSRFPYAPTTQPVPLAQPVPSTLLNPSALRASSAQPLQLTSPIARESVTSTKDKDTDMADADNLNEANQRHPLPRALTHPNPFEDLATDPDHAFHSYPAKLPRSDKVVEHDAGDNVVSEVEVDEMIEEEKRKALGP